jgi:hypothetical protein
MTVQPAKDVFDLVLDLKSFLLTGIDEEIQLEKRPPMFVGPTRIFDEEGHGYFRFSRGNKMYTLILEENEPTKED